MNNELKRLKKELVLAYWCTTPTIPWNDQGPPHTTSARVTGVQAEVWTRHLKRAFVYQWIYKICL